MENYRKRCAEYRGWKKGYYQLVSDGWQKGRLFHSSAQFMYGMMTIGLMQLKFGLRIYAFILMPNHIHIVLSGSGNACVEAFSYFKKRISARLSKDSDPPLPRDYGFKLLPIADKQQMRKHLLYVLRNAYEKGWCTPLGYPWGSGWSLYSQMAPFIRGVRAGTLSKRKMESLIGSETAVPADWEFHPALGLLPDSFVDTSLIRKLFPTVKQFFTRLVKDYESFAQIADEAGEDLLLSEEEVRDIVSHLLNTQFNHKTVEQLGADEKYSLAALLNHAFHLPPETVAQTLSLPEHIVKQVLRSKEYGLRPDFQALHSPRPRNPAGNARK